MKNYLKNLEEPVAKTHWLILGVILAGLNLGLLAAFLILFVFFDEVEVLLFPEVKYQYLTMLVVAAFVVVSLKLWIDYGVLLRKRFKDFALGEKFKKVLIADLIGILPLLALVLLKNTVEGLKYLANPSSVTGWNLANSFILLGALLVQIILVEVVALKRNKETRNKEIKDNTKSAE